MRRLIGIGLLLGAIIGATAPAVATPGVHFPGVSRWGTDLYKIDTCRNAPFGNTDFYWRTKDAAADWSAISGSTFDYLYASPQPCIANNVASTNNLVPNDYTYVWDYWVQTGTPCSGSPWNWPSSSSNYALGCAVMYVPSSSGVERAGILINDDDQIPWFTGSHTSLASGQFDLEGVVTHELGHPLGGADVATCASGSGMETMCGVVDDWEGNVYGRTITSHEKSDVAYRY